MLHPPTFIQQALPEILDKVGLNYVKDNMMVNLVQNRDMMVEKFSNWRGLSVIRPDGTIYMAVVLDLNEFSGF